MAYKCEKCGQAQPAGTKAKKVVTQIRKVSYTNIVRGEVKQSQGFEIAKESTVCPTCA